MPANEPPQTRAAVRPEIQALRALAVALVVVYHLWPAALPGGFVGVDVFFAISGFLITSHLLRTAQRSGRLSVTEFWARRARRILPAALVTLLVCAIATLVVVPSLYRETFLGDVRASTLYTQNWHLASTSSDYLHASDAPSVVRHFWSLAAEEQFYLVWPLLIAAALWTTARRGVDTMRRRRIGIVLGAVVVLSLAYSIWLTRTDPVRAFYVTPVRAWEFGAGGLLALLSVSPRGYDRLRSALSWAAVAGILVAAAVYSGATPFPGYAALLPVIGALAVIFSGMPKAVWSPSRVYRLRGLQFVGDTSYSIYLWHWPLIVLVPFVTHRALDTPARSLIVVLTVLLAWLSKLGVEDPIRRGRLLTRRGAHWTFLAAGAAMAVVLAVSAVGVAGVSSQLRSDQRATQRVLASAPSCLGAAAHDPAHPCQDSKLRYTVIPTPLEAAHEGRARCRIVHGSAPQACAFGVARSKARDTVLLLGDSHALALRPAIEKVARARRWHGISIYMTTCPFTQATPATRGPGRSRCMNWYRDVLRWLGHHPEVSTVIVSGHRGFGVVVPSGQSEMTAKMNGFVRAWDALPRTVKHVIVVRDVPYITERTQDCVTRAIARHRRPGLACAVPRRVALGADPAALAAQQGLSPRAQAIDLTRFFCNRRVCEPVIGGVLVHKDIGHITSLFSKTLGPYVLADIDRQLPGS